MQVKVQNFILKTFSGYTQVAFEKKVSKVVHGDIFIITCICVLVIWFDPTVECKVGVLRWMQSDMAFQSKYLEIRV